MYLPDTNVWIRYLNQTDSGITGKLTSLRPDDVALCSVVLAELFFGAYKSAKQAENLELVELLARQFVSIPFDDAAAAEFGRIRAHLAAQGTPIGPYDLQIAAIALCNGLTVVTHNTDEFTRVPGLLVEDWETSV